LKSTTTRDGSNTTQCASLSVVNNLGQSDSVDHT